MMELLGTSLKLNRVSTHESVAKTLRDAIISGELSMGSSLNEKVLCEYLGVSRTPVREALIDLQGQALVQIIPYRGAFVFDMDEMELEELGKFRAMLEKAALIESLSIAPKALADELSMLVEKMKISIQRRNRKGYGKLDTQYHEAIIQSSKNRFLIDAYGRVGLRLAALRQRIQHDAETVRTSVKTHEEVVDMIKAGESEQALTLLDVHIDGGMKFFSRGMEMARTKARA